MHSVMMNNSIGIYIHIPFCKRKCPYCDFYSIAGDDDFKKKYVNALISHINSYKDKQLCADSVYFGGGTPTALSANELCRILSAVKESFVLCDNCEITTEANPCTVSSDYLKELRKCGFNRISFGVQSARDNELEALGRLHSFNQAQDAVLAAAKAGFDNISCDVMIGVVGQTVVSLEQTIDKLCSLPICHVSAYMLKIEQGTEYDCDKIRSQVADDDLSAELYLAAVKKLSHNGFEQYEISNFCRDGKMSLHNMKYWILDEYIGFGPSAHSYFSGKRFFYDRDIRGYIINPQGVYHVEDEAPDKLYEYTMLSLRLSSGISRERFVSLGGNEKLFCEYSKRLVEAGLAYHGGDRLCLTPNGFLLSNSIILGFLDI